MKRNIRNKKYLAMLIGGMALICILVALVMPNKAQKTGMNQDFTTAVTQNGIIIDNFNFIDSSSPTSTEEYAALHSALELNINNIEKQAANDHLQPVKKALDVQRNTLQTSKATREVLAKVLSYNPNDDLDVEDKTKLSTRAGAAAKGLQAALDNKTLRLPQESLDRLKDTRKCFDSISNGQTDAKYCVDLFDKTRHGINEYLKSLWIAKEVQGSISSLKDLGKANQ